MEYHKIRKVKINCKNQETLDIMLCTIDEEFSAWNQENLMTYKIFINLARKLISYRLTKSLELLENRYPEYLKQMITSTKLPVEKVNWDKIEKELKEKITRENMKN